MNFSNFFSPMTSEKLEKKGQAFYLGGKVLMLIGIIGLGMLLLSMIITMMLFGPEGIALLFLFEFGSGFEFMYLIMPLSYIGILLGIAGIGLYFFGINLYALGRIAHNTEKE